MRAASEDINRNRGARAASCGCLRDAAGPFGVDAVEIRLSRAPHGAGAVDDGIGTGHQRAERIRIVEIARQPLDAGR